MTSFTCPVCEKPIAQSATGRSRRYCSPTCRSKAHREKRQEASKERKLDEATAAGLRSELATARYVLEEQAIPASGYSDGLLIATLTQIAVDASKAEAENWQRLLRLRRALEVLGIEDPWALTDDDVVDTVESVLIQRSSGPDR